MPGPTNMEEQLDNYEKKKAKFIISIKSRGYSLNSNATQEERSTVRNIESNYRYTRAFIEEMISYFDNLLPDKCSPKDLKNAADTLEACTWLLEWIKKGQKWSTEQTKVLDEIDKGCERMMQSKSERVKQLGVGIWNCITAILRTINAAVLILPALVLDAINMARPGTFKFEVVKRVDDEFLGVIDTKITISQHTRLLYDQTVAPIAKTKLQQARELIKETKDKLPKEDDGVNPTESNTKKM